MDDVCKKEHLTHFLKGLPRTERLIVILYYHEEMTISEIAKVLELSKSKVSQMRHSIIERCKAYLQQPPHAAAGQ